ncbi:hypothetical protein [Bacillus sp. FJAT-49736]|uniref:hypothetical protein n=1 Tax=Bacillus sp. FJAT-49736 TaxID=2833582 RepID=UPI002015F734|nr:hypothetical protein [Bacillus sp. FJAT-49736]
MSSMQGKVTPTKADWTVPEKIQANQDFPISIVIKDKKGKIIPKFDRVHEKLMHMIIVSKDLSYFTHIHPEYKGNGKFDITTSLPAGGDYNIITEFTPTGSEDNGVQRHWIHVEGNPPAPVVMEPDKHMTKVIDGKKVTLEFDHIMAGMDLDMKFTIRDANTNKPITDLEPYMGAMGHAVAISKDLKEYLHIHPMTTKKTGSSVKFMIYFPKKGVYKIWGQFQQDGKVFIAPFVVNVDM